MAAIAESEVGLQRGDKILVTGVDGFLGSHVARHLLSSGFLVKGLATERGDEESFSHFVPEGVDETNLEVSQLDLFNTL